MTQVFEHAYLIADLAVCVSTPSEKIADTLCHILGGFSASPLRSPLLHITASVCPDGHIVLQMGSNAPQTFDTLDAFASHLEWRLISQATETIPYLGIHAGAVAFGGQAILFPGASGSGKTTLTLGCLLNGAHLLSDEIALIDPQSSGARPFPRVLCVKQTGLDGLASHALPEQTIRRIGTTACITPRAFLRTPPDMPIPVKTIAFPHYNPNAVTAMNPISRTRALTRLLEQTMNRHRHARTCLAILGRLVENADCYDLPMNNCAEAIAHVMGQL